MNDYKDHDILLVIVLLLAPVCAAGVFGLIIYVTTLVVFLKYMITSIDDD